MKTWKDSERGTLYRGTTPPEPRERWQVWEEIEMDYMTAKPSPQRKERP